MGSDFTMPELRRNRRKKTKRKKEGVSEGGERKPPSFIAGTWDNVGDPTVTHDPTTYTWQRN